ncbi:MAG: EamA family transporter, partial [Acidobacteriota bacterium]
EMICGGALLLLFGLATGQAGQLSLAAISTRSFVALAYLVLFGSLIGFTAYIWLLGATTPARVSTYAYVNPVVAVLLGWGFANEPMTLRTMVAAAVIVSAVVAIIRYGARAKLEPLLGEAAAPEPVEVPVRRAEAR